MAAEISLKRLFGVVSCIVITWRRMSAKICGVDSWDSESSRGSEPPGRCTGIQGQVFASKGNCGAISISEEKPDSKKGSRWEKLEEKAEA